MRALIRALGFLAIVGLSANANAQWTNFTIFSNGTDIYYTPYIFSGSSTTRPIIGTTQRPSGVTTQWLSFDIHSNNYFTYAASAGSAPHIAVGLRANVTCSPSIHNPGCYTNQTGVGILLGNVSGASDSTGAIGCQDPPRAQIENYTGVVHPHLFKSTCSDKLRDGRWYSVVIHAHDNGAVAYWMTDRSTNITKYYGGINVGVNHSGSVGAATGYFVAGISGQEKNWAVEVSNLKTGWF